MTQPDDTAADGAARRLDPVAVGRVAAGAPFLVVGCPRSGTTLVQLMIDSHPRLAVPPETELLVYVGLDPRAPGWDAAEATERVVTHRTFGRLGLGAGEVREMVDELQPVGIAGVLRVVFAMYAVAHGRERWGEKTPIQVFYIAALARLLPDAQFVHVVRDGREVAASIAEVGWGPQSITGGALVWRLAVTAGRRAGSQLGPKRYFEFRLEDLIDDPERVARDICTFLVEPFSEAMLAYHVTAGDRVISAHQAYHPNVSAPPTKGLRDWTAGRTPEEVAAVEVALRPTLARRGYDVPARFTLGRRLAARATFAAGIVRCSPRLGGVVHAWTGRRFTIVARLGDLVSPRRPDDVEV